MQFYLFTLESVTRVLLYLKTGVEWGVNAYFINLLEGGGGEGKAVGPLRLVKIIIKNPFLLRKIILYFPS